MNFTIKQTFDADEKALVAEKIMRTLPEWFGIEKSIIEYKDDVKKLPFFIAYNENNEAVGMISLIEFNDKELESIEIKIIGVLPEYHKQRIGVALIKEAEKFAKEHSKKYLTVKTLSARNPDIFYQRTREFYKKCGFIKLMDIIELWDEKNPCLLMIKEL